MSSINSASESGFDARRGTMVDSQIRTNKVTDEDAYKGTYKIPNCRKSGSE